MFVDDTKDINCSSTVNVLLLCLCCFEKTYEELLIIWLKGIVRKWS